MCGCGCLVVVEVGACWSFSGSAGAAAGAKLRAAGGGALGFLPPHMVRTSENEEETQEHEDSPLLDGEESAGRAGRSGARRAAHAYKAARHRKLEEKLYKYKWAAVAFAACACCLTVIIVAAIAAMAAKEHHRPRVSHSNRAISLMMAEQVRAAEMQQAGRSVGTMLRHQDDLCHGTDDQMLHGFMDNLLAQQCTTKGGVCVQNEDDCSNSEWGSQGEGGVLKGTCGFGCGCCFAGCPPQWVGDGECDFACNTREHGWDGSDCRGASPLFSACPEAWSVTHVSCVSVWLFAGVRACLGSQPS